jgi:hypothetical protein
VKDRTGQVWAQKMHPEDGEGTLVVLVVGPPGRTWSGTAGLGHPVLVLEASGGNWRRDLAEGSRCTLDELGEGDWERNARHNRMTRLA